MAKRFNSGSRAKALLRMANFAIRDQEALIDALTPPKWEAHLAPTDQIAECKANIEDFRRIAREARKAVVG